MRAAIPASEGQSEQGDPEVAMRIPDPSHPILAQDPAPV
jgi:hypothetical protein